MKRNVSNWVNPLEVLHFVRLHEGFLKLLKYFQIKDFLGN